MKLQDDSMDYESRVRQSFGLQGAMQTLGRNSPA